MQNEYGIEALKLYVRQPKDLISATIQLQPDSISFASTRFMFQGVFKNVLKLKERLDPNHQLSKINPNIELEMFAVQNRKEPLLKSGEKNILRNFKFNDERADEKPVSSILYNKRLLAQSVIKIHSKHPSCADFQLFLSVSNLCERLSFIAGQTVNHRRK